MSSSRSPSDQSIVRRRFSLYDFLFETHIAYVLIAPTLLGILLVNVYPLIYTVAVSFQRYKITAPSGTWVGLANYQQILSSSTVLNSVRVSIEYTLGAVAGAFVVGFALALLLNRRLPARGLLRSIFIIPWAIPGFVVALTWAWMYNDQFGIFSGMLRSLGITAPVWLGQDDALLALIAMSVWKNFPFHLLILLAALQAIDSGLYEAAAVDGAGRFAQFRYITIPQVRPMALVALLLGSIGTFQDFTMPWILTQGGPAEATNVIPIATYEIGFVAGDFGYAAAAAVLMFAFILVMSGLYLFEYLREAREAA